MVFTFSKRRREGRGAGTREGEGGGGARKKDHMWPGSLKCGLPGHLQKSWQTPILYYSKFLKHASEFRQTWAYSPAVTLPSYVTQTHYLTSLRISFLIIA